MCIQFTPTGVIVPQVLLTHSFLTQHYEILYYYPSLQKEA